MHWILKHHCTLADRLTGQVPYHSSLYILRARWQHTEPGLTSANVLRPSVRLAGPAVKMLAVSGDVYQT